VIRFSGTPFAFAVSAIGKLTEVEGFYFFNLAEHEQLGWILGPKDVF
jgi:hypothetical protein